ncbi:dnaJ homolog subfamily C member 7 homolog [Macrobrachium nipponense]|uniref:dnaJ homolog subfamily C member 7 homolog n=1 Tax=Macrobrachium nipponense TaxID=159736 RepID=UPI0030C8C753
MLALGKFNFVKNLLALIPAGSMVPFINGNWIRNLGLSIGKRAVALVLGAIFGGVHQYIEGQKAPKIGQDATVRNNDDDLYCATEMISLLKEEWKDAMDEYFFLLDEFEETNFNEAAEMRRNQNLLDDFMEEKYNIEKLGKNRDCAEEENKLLKKKIEELEDELIQKAREVETVNEQLARKERECENHRGKLEELQNQAVDNDFYCGYLEEKVKTHEAERKRLLQATTHLEERLQASQREVSALERNHDLEKNHSNQTQKNLGDQKKVHIQETTDQSLQQEDEQMNETLEEQERLVSVINNSMTSEKNKNNAMVEENKVKGNTFCKLGRLEEASECFLRVLDMDDDHEDYRLRLGLCLLLLGRHREAMKQLKKLDDQEDLVAAAKTLQRMQRHGCPYYILGIAEDANLKAIKWAYRKRALKFNPDNCQGSEEEQHRRMDIMQKVNYANDLLCDADERGEYDAVREFIKDLAAEVFQDPQKAMKVKKKKPGRTTKRPKTKEN